MSFLREVTQETFTDGVLEGSIRKPVVLYFYDSSSDATPIVSLKLSKYVEQRDDINIFQVDIAKESYLARKYASENQPSVVIFKDSDVVFSRPLDLSTWLNLPNILSDL